MRQTLLLNNTENFAPRIDEQGIQVGKSTLVNLRIADWLSVMSLQVAGSLKQYET